MFQISRKPRDSKENIEMTKYWLGHIHLFSPEPEKAAKFYQSAFGAKVLATRKSPDGRLNIDLDISGMRFLVAER